MADGSLETLLARFHAPEVAANPQSIASSLASFVKREDGLQVLRGSLQNNVDPLEQLVPAEFTLPYLYILFVLSFNSLCPSGDPTHLASRVGTSSCVI